MKKFFILAIVLSFSFPLFLFSQNKTEDEGRFIEYPNEFWDKIKKSSEDFKSPKEEKKKRFKMDFSGYSLPEDKKEFTVLWHTPPVSQGWTGTCWCFSGTSFLESEIKRLNGKEMKISEMYTVYWEYVEKARRFIEKRGDSKFAEGSQANAVLRMWKKYGCVPSKAYTGLKEGQEYHDHSDMYREMNSYLNEVKKANAWNEEINIGTIKSILNHYLGAPPERFSYEGKNYTPEEFLKQEVNLNLEDYVDIISLKEGDYWDNLVYSAPDNWWKSDSYKNAPLENFMASLKSAVKSGYTAFIGGDVSSVGYSSHKEVAMIPDFDIPSDYIDDNARQLRYSSGSTTDDHGIHIVGYQIKDGQWWFLIKDSGSGSRNGPNEGYYFYHEDYIKLKMMNFMAHKSSIEELLSKFKGKGL